MTWFEVYIPAKDDDALNVTLTVEAPNWIGALRTGLSNMGEDQDAVSNIMCDIKEDNSIHVTNPNSNRVFRLIEVEAPSDPELAEMPVPMEESKPKAKTPPPMPDSTGVTSVAPPGPPPDDDDEPVRSRERTKAPAPPRTEPQFQEAPAARGRTETKPDSTDPQIGRQDLEEIDINDAIADVFDATQDLLMESEVNQKQVAEKLLDLALEKIPCESGSFYIADINAAELSFAAVRGPKAKDIEKKKLKVPVGHGIVGFSALEGVCLAINDMQHDARYFAAIADAVGYKPSNTLCASAEKEGRCFGAIQLINAKKGGFTPNEMELLRYIGLSAADMLDRAFEQTGPYKD